MAIVIVHNSHPDGEPRVRRVTDDYSKVIEEYKIVLNEGAWHLIHQSYPFDKIIWQIIAKPQKPRDESLMAQVRQALQTAFALKFRSNPTPNDKARSCLLPNSLNAHVPGQK